MYYRWMGGCCKYTCRAACGGNRRPGGVPTWLYQPRGRRSEFLPGSHPVLVTSLLEERLHEPGGPVSVDARHHVDTVIEPRVLRDVVERRRRTGLFVKRAENEPIHA